MHFVRCGCGKPVVWLHGWGCDGEVFAPVVKYLPDFSNYLLDMRGFGKSPPPPQDGWSVADYAEDVFAFLQSESLRRVTVVGHSFGCRVALKLAAVHPECVEQMLLVAPAGLRPFSPKRWLKERIYKIQKRFGKANASRASADWKACPPEMRATFLKVIKENLAPCARKTRCYALIVNGREDAQTPLSQAQRLHKLLKNSDLAEIDGDHFAFFRNPRAFAQTVHNLVE